MRINVKYRAALTEFTKIAGESIDAEDVKDVLHHIKKNYGAKTEKLAKTMLIVVNGQSILQLGHFKTVLQNGDEVSFLPVCGGG